MQVEMDVKMHLASTNFGECMGISGFGDFVTFPQTHSAYQFPF